MNLYYELLNKPVFTLEDINQYYNNHRSCTNGSQAADCTGTYRENQEKHVYLHQRRNRMSGGE